MVQTLMFDLLDQPLEVCFYKDFYETNGNTFIGMLSRDDEDSPWEPFCDVTKNITMLPHDMGYIDVSGSSIDQFAEWLESKGLIKLCGTEKQKGFCSYPLAMLRLERFKPYFFSEAQP